MVAICGGKVEDAVPLQDKLAGVMLLVDTDLSTTAAWGLRDPGAEEGNPATYVIAKDGKITFRRLADNGKDWPTYDEVAAALK